MHSNGCEAVRYDKDSFRPQENDENLFGPKVPYLSVIGALMYLSNCTLGMATGRGGDGFRYPIPIPA